jgi:hypothetical protein
VADNAGAATLTRRHPLTVEGEDVGSIDVTFACGSNTGEYLVLYSETRRTTEGAAAQPLKSVELRLANKTIPLTLGVSRPAQKPGEHRSTASGAVTGAMLHNFAGVGLRSMVIESMAENSDPAVIRIGNTGVTANITQFLESCSQPAGAQPADANAEHAELKSGAQ